jgi:hypothetical protein
VSVRGHQRATRVPHGSASPHGWVVLSGSGGERVRIHTPRHCICLLNTPPPACHRARSALPADESCPSIIQRWGRDDDELLVRFAGMIDAPASAIWDIIRDGARRAELDELMAGS